MNLDANTLANLDILVSSASSSIVFSSSSSSAAASFGGRATGGSRKRERERGSLLWLFSHTRTAFGARLLRQWIRAPLQDADAINQRLDTVTEIVQGVGAWIGPLADALKSGVPDLSRALSRIQYGRTSPSEFLACLEAMQRCVDVLPRAAPSAAGAGVGTARKDDSANAFAVSSDLLQSMLQDLDLPVLRERLRYFIDSLNAEAVKADDKAGLYVDSTLFPSLRQLKLEMEHVGNSLDKELVLIRKQLGAGYSALQYKSVLTTHFLIEVPNTVVKRIPQDWTQMSGTKYVTRFHTPGITALLEKKELLKEQLTLEAQRSWGLFLAQFNEHFAMFRALVQALATLDCLFALADVARLPGYVRPVIRGRRVLPTSVASGSQGAVASVSSTPAAVPSEATNDRVFVVKGGRHPLVEAINSSTTFVPNDVHLSSTGVWSIITAESCFRAN